jgi:hypothetical protein
MNIHKNKHQNSPEVTVLISCLYGYSGIVCGFLEAEENAKIISIPPLINIASTDVVYINHF